ncbi:MAG TPA: preprotein translocase subunit SecG [Myxococcota bacterium]|nr:preprotein translocase subunit SecG [Myxococcota bacterium]
MSAVVTVLHVIVCIFLIAVVLLQRGKGAQVGAVFGGGGGATMFGGRGAGNFLTKLTTGAAIVFMLTSLSLAYMRMHRGERLFEGGAVEEKAPAPPAAPFEDVGKLPAAPGAEKADKPAAEAPAAPAPNPAP